MALVSRRIVARPVPSVLETVMSFLPRWLAVLAVFALGLSSAPASAGVLTFEGQDAGAGPTDPRPQTDAAATAFQAAAGLLNPTQAITFESLPLGQPATDGVPLAVAPGVAVTLQGADHNPPTGYNFGVTQSPNDVLTGYNTTPGGNQHFAFAPQLNVGTASLIFTFDTPIQAFGATITGLGTGTGNLHVLFDDGAAHDILITGSTLGGAQFFGFTDPKTFISSVTFQFQGVTGGSRDVIGVDDVLFAPSVPEPTSLVLAMMGALGVLSFGYRMSESRMRPARGAVER